MAARPHVLSTHPPSPWSLLPLPILGFRHTSFLCVPRTHWPCSHLRTFALASAWKVLSPDLSPADSFSSFYLLRELGKSCKGMCWVLLPFIGWQRYLLLRTVRLDQLSLGEFGSESLGFLIPGERSCDLQAPEGALQCFASCPFAQKVSRLATL